MSAKGLLVALCNMRTEMMRKGVSHKDPRVIAGMVQRAKAWMDAWTPTEEQCAAYIKRHWNEVELMLPGGDTKQAQTWRERYMQILSK